MLEIAIADFIRAKESLLKALATTPDDRLLWSPSSTSRSILHIAAHAAFAAENLGATFDGKPFPISDPVQADREFRKWETSVTKRAEVVAEIERVFDAYVAWLRALPPERLDETVELPFGMGAVPLGAAIGFPTLHTQAHIAQIQYIQTIYGDRDWHM